MSDVIEDSEGVWMVGDPGPSGEPRADGMHPCQCHTCSACGEHTNQTAAEAEGVPSANYLLCMSCFKSGHRPMSWKADKSRDKWSAPMSFSTNPEISEKEAAWQAEQDRIAAEETARRKATADLNYWDSVSPARYKKSVMDKFSHENEDASPDINAFIENLRHGRVNGRTLMLCGTLGAGKTYLMYSIARKLVLDRVIAPQLIRFGSEAELLQPTVQGFPSDRAEYVARLTDPSRTRLILIDEAGRGNFAREDDRLAAWDILTSFAYSHDVPVILATNLLASPVSGSVQGQPVVDGGGVLVSPSDMVDFSASPSPDFARELSGADGGGAAAGGEGVSYLADYIGDAAYDRLINSTPRGSMTQIVSENKRAGVNSGEIPRNHGRAAADLWTVQPEPGSDVDDEPPF